MTEQSIVTTDWLEQHLQDPNVRVLDIRGTVVTKEIAPNVDKADYRGLPEAFLEGHIPGASFVDWTKDVIDPDDPVPVQIAPADRFAKAMGERGVGKDTLVVAVDSAGGQFATRLWWALRYFGHENVAVLDGGWNRWKSEGRPVEQGPTHPPTKVFQPKVNPSLRATWQDVMKLDRSAVQLIDARDSGQYSGNRRRGPRRQDSRGQERPQRALRPRSRRVPFARRSGQGLQRT